MQGAGGGGGKQRLREEAAEAGWVEGGGGGGRAGETRTVGESGVCVGGGSNCTRSWSSDRFGQVLPVQLFVLHTLFNSGVGN